MRGWMVVGMLIAAPMALPASTATAQTSEAPTVERFGSEKFWDYAACGASIVFASGTGSWILAGIVCGKAITEHWTD